MSPQQLRNGLAVAAAFLFLGVAVVLFSSGWRHGELLLDGPGVATWVQVLLDSWRDGTWSYWMPEMWAGSPFFGIFPSLHMLMLLPLAAIVGSEEAVKVAIIGAQVVGAWGAFVLARSLWNDNWPAGIAGLFYGCHTYFVASGPLFGHEASVWVFAITPWLVWSLRKALRREGARHVALAGLFAGFAILQQAEHAFGLVVLCGALVVIHAARARRTGRGPTGPGGVLFRAGAAALLGVGTTAYWLIPFLGLKSSFVLTSPADVKLGLKLLSGALGQRPGAFLARAGPAGSTYDFEHLFTEFVGMKGTAAASFYLGWVCLLLTLVAIIHIARRDDDDGTLPAILLASVLGIWLSMGPVPLAGSDLTSQERIIVFAFVGGSAGLLVGTFLRRLHIGRWGGLATVAAAILLFAVPYISPILTLQRLVPFLEYIRFPRFFPLAGLGVALGAAYPLSRLRWWARRRRPAVAPLFGLAVALALAGLFIVDMSPYRDYYRIRPPLQEEAYRAMGEELDRFDIGARIAVPAYGDPQLTSELVARGRLVTSGWPHPLAQHNLWRLSAEAFDAPTGYRDSALALSATGFIAEQRLNALEADPRRIVEVILTPIPQVLPLVRAYERVVALKQDDITPELAVALAQRNIGVVAGGFSEEAMNGVQTSFVSSQRTCEEPIPGAVGKEIAMACGLHQWIGVPRPERRSIQPGVGAVIQSSMDGLRGLSVWLDRPPGATELSLYELSSDGRSLGRELRRVKYSGFDHNDMPVFSFDPIEDSANLRYAFLLTCAECDEEEEPKVTEVEPERVAGNLIVGNELRPEGVLAFSAIYDRIDVAKPPATRLRSRQVRPGEWRISVEGPRPALVVVAEAFFPGWEARVDGRKAAVLEADGAFLGVPVPAGSHEVSLSFHRPRSTIVGRLITAATVLACVLLVVIGGAAGKRRLLVDPGRRLVTGTRPRPRNYDQDRQDAGRRRRSRSLESPLE